MLILPNATGCYIISLVLASKRFKILWKLKMGLSMNPCVIRGHVDLWIISISGYGLLESEMKFLSIWKAQHRGLYNLIHINTEQNKPLQTGGGSW